MIPTNVSRSNSSSSIRRDALLKFSLAILNKRFVHTEGTDGNHNNRGIMNKSFGNGIYLSRKNKWVQVAPYVENKSSSRSEFFPSQAENPKYSHVLPPRDF